MARTETEGGTNWVHTGATDMPSWDITRIKPCTSVIPSSTGTTNDGNGNCTYAKKADLRYIYIF